MARIFLALLPVLAGCAWLRPPAPPPEPPTKLAEVRPGYVAGYLEPDQLPDSISLVPVPPKPGSWEQGADEAVYKATRALRGTPRWNLAANDAELRFPAATQVFSCTLGIPISADATPHLNMLLRRIRMDASRANDKAKDHYKRQRPYLARGDASCTPHEKDHSDSYPSGHASIGWAWALTLAQIVPDKADDLLARGVRFGNSRYICGVHWKSDVEAGRLVGAATVSRLHDDPVYRAQQALARREIEAARASGAKPSLDCEAEKRALAEDNLR
jgi:acid phosphatase (class A)